MALLPATEDFSDIPNHFNIPYTCWGTAATTRLRSNKLSPPAGSSKTSRRRITRISTSRFNPHATPAPKFWSLPWWVG